MGPVADREQFEELFDGQFVRCVALAYRIVHDHEVAEEVASEAFARAWARWARLANEHHADGWVLRATVNLAIDNTRRRTQGARPPDPGMSVEDAATLRVALVHALQALPRRQREVVALRYLVGMSEAGVSAALGVSAGSVKTHLHRGLTQLRSSLPQDDDVEVELAHGS
jgi:RNA polymerase sigma-70 factor (sigma-E family)